MKAAPRPSNEADRLQALRAYNVLDSPPEEAFDDLTRLASQICETPVALVSLVDADRDWFKSRIGLTLSQTPRDVSFTAHAITQADLFVVPDATTDARFAGNPLVTGPPHVRFYAAMPLAAPGSGLVIGALCLIDWKPRQLTAQQIEALRIVSHQVIMQLELRRNLIELERSVAGHLRAEEARVHTMLIIGQKEQDAHAVSVRVHGKGSLGVKPRAEVITEILAAIRERKA